MNSSSTSHGYKSIEACRTLQKKEAKSHMIATPMTIFYLSWCAVLYNLHLIYIWLFGLEEFQCRSFERMRKQSESPIPGGKDPRRALWHPGTSRVVQPEGVRVSLIQVERYVTVRNAGFGGLDRRVGIRLIRYMCPKHLRLWGLVKICIVILGCGG